MNIHLRYKTKMKNYFRALTKNVISSKKNNKRNFQKGDIFHFYGENEELDDRITRNKNNFQQKITLINKKINSLSKVKIIIGISRYNFFKLDKIAQFCLNIFDLETDLSWINFKLFPLANLIENFNNYLKEINSHLPKYIKLKIDDPKLKDILLKTQNLALKNTDNEAELARLLGIICENAFVGPRVMVIDPHHKCNTNCTHCWVHTPKVKHDKEFLNLSFPMDRFKNMIDNAAELKVETIILQGDGEPLLHPNSLDMLKYASSKGLDVRFFTNGILLNEKIAREIVKIGVKEIYCSFPAGSPETYKTINPIQKMKTYHKVVKNLKKLMEIKKQANTQDPKVIVTHVIHTQNHHELVKMAQDDVYEGVDAARFYLIRLDIMNKFLQLKPNEYDIIKKQIPIVEKTLKKGNVEFVDNIKFQLENYSNKDGSWCSDVFLEKGCTIGYFFNLVPAKGDISFCCHLRTVGDLKTDSYKKIWTSDKYNKWRYQAKFMKSHRDAKFINNQLLYDDHCTHCDNHQTILESYDKLKKYELMEYYGS